MAFRTLENTLTTQRLVSMKIAFLILSVFIIISCEKKQETYVEKYRNSKLDSLETIIGKIATRDTACLKQIDSAEKKIRQDRLIYYLYMTEMSYGRNLEELKTLLKPYGIGCELFLTSCLYSGDGRRYCYVDYMNQTIKNKFKKGFIDSLEVKADRIYLTKNIDRVYNAMDQYDETIFYPKAKSAESQREDTGKEFFSTFKYPKDFSFKHDKYIGRSIVEFILYRNGKIKNLKIETEFEQKINNRFIPYFDNEIKTFVSKTKWIPRKQRGISVNGRLSLWIPYK